MADKRIWLPLLSNGVWVSMMLALSASALAQWDPSTGNGEVFRWADDEGNVHYTAALPAEYADRPYDVIRNGIVIRRVSDPANPDAQGNAVPPVMTEEERQQQIDRMLVLRFRSLEDLDTSMENDLGQLSYDRRMLESSRSSMYLALQGQVRQAANVQRAGSAVPPATAQQIDKLRNDLQFNRRRMAELNARRDGIRAEYDEWRERYRYLVSGGES